MLAEILLRIYCLPLWKAGVLVLFAAGLFCWMHRRWENRRWWRGTVLVLFLCWSAVVLAQTVWLGRTTQRTLSLIPFQCYLTVFQGGEKELLRSAFMNVLLFYPGGILVQSLCRSCSLWKLTVLVLLGSVAIECCQYGFGIGTAETDDIIHNTLGAFLGMLSVRQFQARQRS